MTSETHLPQSSGLPTNCPENDPWSSVRKVSHRRAKEQCPILDILFPGFRTGRVGGLISPGGVGKSMFALELAIAVACPLPEANLLGIDIPAHGRVVYLSGEDDLDEFEARLHSIHKVLELSGKSDEILEALDRNLEILDFEDAPRDILNPVVFAEFAKRSQGARLIVIDTLSMFHAADENSNTEMSKVLAQLKLLAKRNNACVLYLHHTSKAMAINGRHDEQQSARGASCLVDNSRYICYLQGMSKQEYERLNKELGGKMPFPEGARKNWVLYGASKQNGGGRIDDFWLVRVEGGVLVRKADGFWGVKGSDYNGAAAASSGKAVPKRKEIPRGYV